MNDETTNTEGFRWFQALAMAAEFGEDHLVDHLLRVSAYTVLIAKGVGMNTQDLERLRVASLLHDVGKSGVPLEHLRKPGELNKMERYIVEHHTHIGYELIYQSEKILADVPHPIDRETWQMAKEVALLHHENWDGTGYPEMRRQQEIPFYARVVRIADTLDALQTDRVYKAAWPWEHVVAEIEAKKGKAFDPILAQWVIENQDNFMRGVSDEP